MKNFTLTRLRPLRDLLSFAFLFASQKVSLRFFASPHSVSLRSMSQKHCVDCRKVKQRHEFSASQLKKTVSKCQSCILKANPKATPAGGNEPKKFRPVGEGPKVVPRPRLSSLIDAEGNSPFDGNTIDLLDTLRREGKMRPYVPLEGRPWRLALMCNFCGRFTNVKRFGEDNFPRYLCLTCETISKELGMPLDMTEEEVQALYHQSCQKTMALELAKCETIGEMAFTVAHSKGILDLVHSERQKDVSKFFGSE